MIQICTYIFRYFPLFCCKRFHGVIFYFFFLQIIIRLTEFFWLIFCWFFWFFGLTETWWHNNKHMHDRIASHFWCDLTLSIYHSVCVCSCFFIHDTIYRFRIFFLFFSSEYLTQINMKHLRSAIRTRNLCRK